MHSVFKVLIMIGILMVSLPTHAQHDLSADNNDAINKLRLIGVALRAYAADHPTNVWPGRLTDLVTNGYLQASNLLCIADYSGGSEGGKPDCDIDLVGSQFPEVDEPNCSFFYEFNEAPCSWYQPGFLFTNLPMWSSWRDVKLSQLCYGDMMHQAPYQPAQFPVVRCFWFGFGVSNVYGAQTVLNLAADMTTVFASTLSWEADKNGEWSEDRPRLRDVIIYNPENGYITPSLYGRAEVGKLLLFPLWPVAAEVSNFTYHITASAGAGDHQAMAIEGDTIFKWTPNHFTPSNASFTIELLRDGVIITSKSYQVSIFGTDGDGMPDEWELASFQTLSQCTTTDYDSDGFLDFNEYVAGTCPTNENDYLSIRSICRDPDTLATILRWPSIKGRAYHVLRSTNLTSGWITNSSSIPGNGGEVMITNETAASQEFYMLNVRIDED